VLPLSQLVRLDKYRRGDPWRRRFCHGPNPPPQVRLFLRPPQWTREGVARYDANGNGRLEPEERLYNDYGDLTELHTYQSGTNWSSASWPGAGQTARLTRWTYDAATGLVLGKFDDVGRGYTNMYHWTRTLWRRHWARGVVVTNSFNVFGELLAKEYSDGTPSVRLGDYNAVGQPASVTDGFGTANFAYDEDGHLLRVEYGWDSPFSGLSLTNRIDPVYGRDRVVVDGQFENPYQFTTEYVFDTATGRLSEARTWHSTGAGTSVTNSVSYQYLADSDLVERLTAKTGGSTVMTASKIWDYGYRLRRTSTGLGSSGPALWSFEYEYDTVDRRVRAKLADHSAWNYQYDDRNQVVSGKRVWWDTTPVAGQQFEYAYDQIGNRTATKVGGDTNGMNLRLANYTNNMLDQITGRAVPGYADVIGAATATATNVSVNGQPVDCRRVEYYWKQLAVSNGTGPRWQGVTNSATLSNQTATVSGDLLVPPAGQTFAYDADGNLTNDTVWAYSWHGENRLKSMEVLASAAASGVPRVRLEFGYDWQGRRVSKAVLTNWNGSIYQTTNLTRFLYDGWRPVAELAGDNALVRSYAWGLDLSGTIEDAGGIGGLVEILDYSTWPPGRHFTVFDGNGNIVALVQSDGTVSARYEYGPFGEPIRETGTFARSNPFRWSTKYWDPESDLVYYGYRYYSPSLGRWISRDPIEEDAGLSVYGYARNSTVSSYDPLGLANFSWDSQGFHIRDRGLTYMPVFNDNGTWDVMPKPGHERNFDRVRARASLDKIMGDHNLFQRMKNAHTFGGVENGGGQRAWKFFGKGEMFDINNGDTKMQSVIRRQGRNMWRAMRHARKVMGAAAVLGAMSSSLQAADIAESYARHRQQGDVAMADLDAIDLAVVIADLTGNYYMGYLALDIMLEP